MTNFLRKLMFWRKSPEGEASGPLPSSGPNDDRSPTPEELDYQAEREEELLEDRREQDDVAP
jgi:hypothetical protein